MNFTVGGLFGYSSVNSNESWNSTLIREDNLRIAISRHLNILFNIEIFNSIFRLIKKVRPAIDIWQNDGATECAITECYLVIDGGVFVKRFSVSIENIVVSTFIPKGNTFTLHAISFSFFFAISPFSRSGTKVLTVWEYEWHSIVW